jgi:peptidylprolyl isomerase
VRRVPRPDTSTARLTPLRAAALAASALVLLTGCWTQADDTAAPEPSAAASTPAASPATSAPAVTAPEPACPAGSAADSTYECAGATVTGAKDAEPTIELAEDFGPAEELLVADVYEGEGDPVAPGATLTVNYVGVGQQSREVFDSSWPGGQPATFPLERVIQGWQQGMVGMKPGGRRLLVIPGSLAYGPGGNPPVIGPDETLVFVVDLIEQTPAA